MTASENVLGSKKIYQFHIHLTEIQPPIWRRIQAPGDISLFRLHFILQIAMGWTNSHLHEFHIGDRYYGIPDEDGWDTREALDERAFRLDQVVSQKGIQFDYLYDFGDSWKHAILVEDILDPVQGERYPTCLDGRRACPPEDVGGVWGYAEFLEAVADPDHLEHDEYLTWAGGAFDPEAFDRGRVDAQLKNIEQSEMIRVYQRYYSGEIGPELELYQGVSEWLEALTAQERSQLEELPLRRDAISLLTYLRDHPTTGTQSTGNLPLKAIREATRGFVHPPVLESVIGERVYKIRSEYDIWQVYFIHALLDVGGLLAGGPSRRIRLTSKGEGFLTSPPPIQAWFLLEAWWYHTNWMIASPHAGLGERLPYDFTHRTLGHLLSLPVDRPIPFDDFADRLIQQTGLKWTAPDMSHARELLRRAIERMVISVLEDFHLVERTEKDILIGGHRFKKLHTFTVTKLGRGLLQAVGGGFFK